jgi:hypothetical protein
MPLAPAFFVNPREKTRSGASSAVRPPQDVWPSAVFAAPPRMYYGLFPDNP